MSLYRLSRQADADLDDIADYVAADSPRAVIGILGALHDAFQTLAASPDIGSLRDDLMPSLRMFTPKHPASNYIIFYYVILDGIEVSDIIHGARGFRR